MLCRAVKCDGCAPTAKIITGKAKMLEVRSTILAREARTGRRDVASRRVYNRLVGGGWKATVTSLVNTLMAYPVSGVLTVADLGPLVTAAGLVVSAAKLAAPLRAYNAVTDKNAKWEAKKALVIAVVHAAADTHSWESWTLKIVLGFALRGVQQRMDALFRADLRTLDTLLRLNERDTQVARTVSLARAIKASGLEEAVRHRLPETMHGTLTAWVACSRTDPKVKEELAQFRRELVCAAVSTCEPDKKGRAS
jgi:hypothetical protein